MIIFNRYPHVRALVLHYAKALKNDDVLALMDSSVESSESAALLSTFVWNMIDQMALDTESEVVVMGRTDNLDLIPDVDYEIGIYLNDQGFGAVWDDVCDKS